MCDHHQLRSVSIQGFVLALAGACAPVAPVARADAASAHTFAVQHHQDLQREVRGSAGPNVRTLAILAKCRNIIHAASLLTEKKDEIYPVAQEPSAEVAAARLLAVLSSDAELGCTAASADEEDANADHGQGEARAKRDAQRANMKEQFGD